LKYWIATVLTNQSHLALRSIPLIRPHRAFEERPSFDGLSGHLSPQEGEGDKAFFSLFHCTARHGTAGIRLEDRLEGNRGLRLMDETVEASAPAAAVLENVARGRRAL